MKMEFRKKTAILLIAIFMISTLALPYAFAFDYLQTGPTGGEAYFTSADKHSGLGSVFLSNGGVEYTDPNDYGAGRIVIPVNILLADIDSLSYWFNYEFPDTFTLWHNFPYIVLEMDKSGGDTPDVWIVLCSTRPEWRDYYGDPNAPMPDEGTWVQWTLSGDSPPSGYDNFHDSGPGALHIGTPTEGATLSDIQAGYVTGFPDAKILSVKVAVGEWFYYGEELLPVTTYVDDIEINGVTYGLENSGVSMTVTVEEYVEPVIVSISVEPNTILFGDVVQGQDSEPKTVVITNIGDVAVIVSTAFADGTDQLYIDHLEITGIGAPITIGLTQDAILTLHVPLAQVAGTYEGTLIFWAEQAS